MKQFTTHLDYLIQGNDCVIIPDFGGFVLNKESAFITPEGNIIPPRVVVGFNPDLKHNDGLLAESYMCLYSISYEAACNKIKTAVDNLNTQLNEKKNVRLGHLGKLRLDENGQLIFIPDQSISLHYPDTYGLSFLNIKPIVKESTRKTKLYKWYTGAAAAAAAILIFFVSTISIEQDRVNINIQKSGFFIDALSTSKTYNNFSSEDLKININDKSVEQIETNTTDKKEVENNVVNHDVELVNIKKETISTIQPLYYVVIGSAKSQNEVDRLTAISRKNGIKDFKVLDRGNNRYYIYTVSFQNRSDAENYLIGFRKKTTNYKDAWIYSSKTNS